MGHGTAYVARKGTNAQHRGGTLTLAVANLPGVYELPIPTSLDPASGYSAGSSSRMTNDGLLGYSQAGSAEAYKVVPDLATGLPTVSDGGLTYAFQLRKGIRYSTGGIVQAAHIRRGIERALLESACQTPGSYLAVIRGAGGCLTGKHCDLTSGITTSPGSSTVTFHLSKPDPDFLFQLALPTTTPSRRRRRSARGCRCPRPARTRSRATRRRASSSSSATRASTSGRRRRNRTATRTRSSTLPLHRRAGDPRGRARPGRRHRGRPRPDLATRARRLTPDALLEPALPRADPLPPGALAEHEARAVQRRSRPPGAQPRGRP